MSEEKKKRIKKVSKLDLLIRAMNEKKGYTPNFRYRKVNVDRQRAARQEKKMLETTSLGDLIK